MQDYEDESFWRKRGPVIGGLMLLLALGLVGVYVLHGLKGASAPEPPKIQEISLVQPPPPPPPPKIEQPPPPEEKIKLPEPEPEPKAEETPDEEPPPSADLGLDADGVAGSDGFGLQARKGGNGIIGGGGDRNRWYAGLVQRNLQTRLADNDAARGAKYSLIVKLWITTDGRIDRFEFVNTVGDSKSDVAIREALSGLRLIEQPPSDMPQPIKLRIVSR